MQRQLRLTIPTILLLIAAALASAQQTYVGFDRNDYPGDAALPTLHKSFTFTGYWLNTPPGDNQNSWLGKRALLKQQGFGFLVLWNGRMYSELKGHDAAAMGAADAKEAIAAAQRESFASNVLIFLDVEEGGRMLPEQTAYIFAWSDAVQASGARAGAYCTGAEDKSSTDKITAPQDIAQKDAAHIKATGHGEPLVLWVAQDTCPPSPGCTVTHSATSVASSLKIDTAHVWQYALSPRRKEYTTACPKNYDPDTNCYAPGLPHSASTLIDMDLADSPNPSEAP
jgi:Domain of unknown function (DUF1906)